MDYAVKNLINRLRICVRLMCCIPIEHIIPSEIFQKKSKTHRLRRKLPQTRPVRELRFEAIPKSKSDLKNNHKKVNSVQKLISKSYISKSQCSLKDIVTNKPEKKDTPVKGRSILKDRNKQERSVNKPNIDNPITEVPLKKHHLSFQTSEKQLQSKKARCRLFRSRSKKKLKKPGAEASDLISSLRWRRKSSTSGRSSENGSKCKKPEESKKKGNKLKIKGKECVRLKFVCSDSNSAVLTNTEKDVVGDGPIKGYDCRNPPPIDVNRDFIMDYFRDGTKDNLR